MSEPPTKLSGSDRTDARDDLITRVQRGEMAPADAESAAERLGLDPLASKPDPNQYDPMQEAFWTISMAAAWIAYRSTDAVRNWWQTYRQEFRVWQACRWQVPGGPVYEGHMLEPRAPATLALSADLSRNNADDVMRFDKAIEELWRAMQTGQLVASGIDVNAGERVSISKEEWFDLTWFEERGKDVIGTAPTCDYDRRYRDVVVPSEAVRSQWPVTLPELMKPEGAGYMPLYCAAQWIATQGGAISFDPYDQRIWKAAYDQLLGRIASEEISVVGIRDGQSHPIPGYQFVGIRVEYPFSDAAIDLLLSEEIYLSSCAFLDEQSWRQGHDDSLQNRDGPQWRRLMVQKSDISEYWPFGVPRSGAPGRPSSMHLVEDEFAARCKRGEVAGTVKRESEILRDWLRAEHSNDPRPTAKTIENNLREAYRRYQKTRN